MPTLGLALAQVNPTVGDLVGNARHVLDTCEVAARTGARLVAFPEMVLTGYPIEDLALRPSFLEASKRSAERLAADLVSEGHGDLTVVVGLLDGHSEQTQTLGVPRNRPVNAAWVMHGGRVIGRYGKHHLPNYGVFDEYRYFVPGTDPCVFEVDGVRVSLAICEDLWQDGGPVLWAAEARADLLLVINGSPYERAKDDVRLALCRRRAAEAGMTLAYANIVGGQDELVFDGDSMIVAADGTLLARAPQFEPYLLVTNLAIADSESDSNSDTESAAEGRSGQADSTPDPRRLAPVDVVVASDPAVTVGDGTDTTALGPDAEVYNALVLGLRDYVRKNGFASVVLGLSGGIDSALVAAIAADAIGPGNVHGVSMPSAYSSQHSRDDAAASAAALGLHYRIVPIEPMVQSFQDALALTGLAEENLQARVRAVALMGISNSEGHLVLATGNKTELAVGYSTIYGDAVGGFAPIKDVPKMDVWRLARWRNGLARTHGDPLPVPESSIAKPPSAELRPGQLDTDSLPDYKVLDDLLDDYVELDRGAAHLIAQGFDAHLVERVLKLTDTAEYKRRQYPPGPKVTTKAFGRDRRLPITNRWRERPR